MEFTLRGESLSITQADVIRVTQDASPAPVDGRNKYFVSLHGRNYPIKQVLRLLSGLPSASFTAQDAYRILARVGFDVFEDPTRAVNEGTPARIDAGAADAPAVGESARRGGGDVRKLLVVFHRDEDGWEVASCPTLPGCHSQGRTREEALRNVREAIRGYLASLREHGAASPPSSEFQVIDVRV